MRAARPERDWRHWVGLYLQPACGVAGQLEFEVLEGGSSD